MKKSDLMIVSAVAGMLTLAVSAPLVAQEKGKAEKCYGVVKAGKNDCQTATSACAGTSTKDAQADAWVYLPKGTCEKLVGGALKPKKG